MTKESEKDIAPVGFLTPFPRSSSRPCGTPRVDLLPRFTAYQPLLQPPRWSHRAHTVLGALRASLEEQLRKAKSSDVALTPSQILSMTMHPKLFQALKNVMNLI